MRFLLFFITSIIVHSNNNFVDTVGFSWYDACSSQIQTSFYVVIGNIEE